MNTKVLVANLACNEEVHACSVVKTLHSISQNVAAIFVGIRWASPLTVVRGFVFHV